MLCRVITLVSGTGRNLQTLIDEVGEYGIVAVISNKADADAITERLQQTGKTVCRFGKVVAGTKTIVYQ